MNILLITLIFIFYAIAGDGWWTILKLRAVIEGDTDLDLYFAEQGHGEKSAVRAALVVKAVFILTWPVVLAVGWVRGRLGLGGV